MRATVTGGQELAASPSDECLYGDRPAFIQRDQHEVINGIFSAVDSVQHRRKCKRLGRVVVRDVALVLKLDECAGETPDRLGEEALVLLEVSFRITVSKATVDTHPRMLADPVMRGTNQAVHVAGSQSVKHSVVRGTHGSPQGVLEWRCSGGLRQGQ